jgi:hypothetical protein
MRPVLAPPAPTSSELRPAGLSCGGLLYGARSSCGARGPDGRRTDSPCSGRASASRVRDVTVDHPPLPFVRVDVPATIRNAHNVLGLHFLQKRDFLFVVADLPLNVFGDPVNFSITPHEGELIDRGIADAGGMTQSSFVFRLVYFAGIPARGGFLGSRHGGRITLNLSSTRAKRLSLCLVRPLSL